jgi:hypothetical protein
MRTAVVLGVVVPLLAGLTGDDVVEGGPGVDVVRGGLGGCVQVPWS